MPVSNIFDINGNIASELLLVNGLNAHTYKQTFKTGPLQVNVCLALKCDVKNGCFNI